MLPLKNTILQKAGNRKELWRINIKQAIQGLFTTGTSEKKEKVGGKRGLKRLDSCLTNHIPAMSQ